MKCKKCGFENKEDSKFCENCGYKIEETPLKNRLFVIGLAVVVICVVAVVGFYLRPGEEIPSPSPTTHAGVWRVEGRLIDFTTICDLKPESSGPLSVELGGKFTMTGCTTLDEELQQPLALSITIRNSSNENQILSVPLLLDVIVHTQEDPKQVLAFCIPGQWISTGGSCSWATRVEGGTLKIEIGPDGAVELLYLVPQFDGKATIELVNIGSFEVEV
ncbi:MAG: zinc ribbon domain-containing protein [Theionarchaea archaeon]|nr:MAG: hypothetical protein AYK19_18395 [Theionarchaea archaeon DG-70-1]MBU7027137.1 zinc ribbon domain-containing protein [Theionarchaea archaeon]